MSQASSKAQPASFEDCDDDSGVVLPNSKVEAIVPNSRTEAMSKPPPNSQARQASNARPDKVRYARTTSSRPPTRSSTPSIPTQTRPKPIVHETRPKSTVQQTMPPPLSRTNSMKKQNRTCDDSQCRGACLKVNQHRSSTPHQPAPLHVQTQNLPSARVARPRTTPMPQGRPLSWAGFQAPYAPEYVQQPVMSPREHGPPPAPSAYHRTPNQYYQTNTGYGYVMNQPAVSPMISSASPLDSTPLSGRRANLDYSARMDPSQAPPFTSPISTSARLPRARTPSISYTQRPEFVMKETYIVDEPAYFSESESDHDEYYPQQMPPSLRPVMKTTRTAPAFTPRSVYKGSGRASHPDNGVDLLTQDFQDHSIRPSLQRAYSSANSSRSRRQSLSTNASSARTKATTVSAGSIIVEGPNGARRYYPSDREYESLLRRMERQRKLENARAYQEEVGGYRDELTAANIRDYSDRVPDVARSRASGHSRQSNSKDGIQIVYAGTRVDVRPANEHIPAQIIIDPISGLETRYTASSHSSSSRIGRSLGSDRGHRN